MRQLLFLVATVVTGMATAQTLKSSASCDLTLSIQSESGTNGLGVTFDAKNKIYYTAFAGNEVYPMESFTENGTFKATSELGVDVRGFWYDAASGTLKGFAYDNMGSYELTLSGGSVVNTVIDATKFYGETGQAVGVYCDKLKSVMFVSDGEARFYKKAGGKAKKVALTMNSAESLDFEGAMYTGVKGKEIALFNYETYEVEFYSASSGKKTGSCVLELYNCSEDMDVPTMFRVAYANKKVWLFDANNREWLGFSVWN